MPSTAVKKTEEDIVRGIQPGDQRAFKELFYLYYKQLCHFAHLFIHSKEMCEEAVLDVFFHVWVRREQLDPKRNIRSFLYVAVRNQAIKYCQRENPVHSQNNIDICELEMESPEPSVDEVIDRKLFRERLQKAYCELPERCRIIAQMHFSEQLQYREIAEILEISNESVRVQIGIAIQKIKKIFQKYGWDK